MQTALKLEASTQCSAKVLTIRPLNGMNWKLIYLYGLEEDISESHLKKNLYSEVYQDWHRMSVTVFHNFLHLQSLCLVPNQWQCQYHHHQLHLHPLPVHCWDHWQHWASLSRTFSAEWQDLHQSTQSRVEMTEMYEIIIRSGLTGYSFTQYPVGWAGCVPMITFIILK